MTKLEFLEEPLVLACLIPVLELDLGLSLGLVFKSRVSEDVLLMTVLSKGVSTEYIVGMKLFVVTNFPRRLDF